MTVDQVTQEVMNHPNVEDAFEHFKQAIVEKHFYILFKLFGSLALHGNQQNLFSFFPIELIGYIGSYYCAVGNEATWFKYITNLEPGKVFDRVMKDCSRTVLLPPLKEKTSLCSQFSALSLYPAGYLPSFNNRPKVNREEEESENTLLNKKSKGPSNKIPK